MPEHKSLFAALAAFQAEAPTLPKTATNPHFRSKFTPLDVIVEQTRGLLSKHGIVWIAKPGENAEGRPVLNYTLAHATTGEREDGSMPLLLTKADSQGQGSAITYARRYALCAVLNLVADDDDDGNAASTAQNGQAQQPKMTARAPQATPALATAKQRGLINARASGKQLAPLALLNIVRAAGGSDSPLDVPDDAARVTLSKAMDRLPRDLVDPILEAIEQVDDVMPEPVA